jgi:hypothetical protein
MTVTGLTAVDFGHRTQGDAMPAVSAEMPASRLHIGRPERCDALRLQDGQ